MPAKTITNTLRMLLRVITNRNKSTGINTNQQAPLRTPQIERD